MTATHYGWTNRETWAAHLWITNSGDGGESMAEDAIEQCDGDRDEAIDALADTLEALHEKSMPEVTGVYADLLNHALSAIDWREIAESLLEE